MDALAGLLPVIDANAKALQQPGVLGIRPGYRSDAQGRLTKEKAIVVLVAPGAKPQLPAQAGGFPIDIRPADDVEQFRAQDPKKYVQVASVRAEFRTGAFPEAGPIAEAALPPGAVPEALATKPQLPYTGPDGVQLAP